MSFLSGTVSARCSATLLVLLENNRSEVLKLKSQRAAMMCIRCGACLNHCPIFTASGGHSYGWVYSGPIGAVIDPTLAGPRASELPFASSLCGACKDACPIRIDIPSLLLEQRAEAMNRRGGEFAIDARTQQRAQLTDAGGAFPECLRAFEEPILWHFGILR